MCRGEARASQVTGPSSSCVPWSNTPPDTLPSSPTHAGGRCGLRDNPALSASGKTIGFGAAVPRPARSHAYASQALLLGSAPGLLPARAGSPLAGRDSHPLDDEQSFMETSHPPIPFDQQGLVALNFLSARNLDGVACSWVASCTRLAVTETEAPKATQFHFVSRLQRIHNTLQETHDHRFGLVLRELHSFCHLVNELCLCHTHISSTLGGGHIILPAIQSSPHP